jgi:hypothetical protein
MLARLRTLLKIWLVVYFLLVAAAAVTSWRAGLLAHVHRGWAVAALAIALLPGILLALLSRR